MSPFLSPSPLLFGGLFLSSLAACGGGSVSNAAPKLAHVEEARAPGPGSGPRLDILWNPGSVRQGAEGGEVLLGWTLEELQARRKQWTQVQASEGRGASGRRSQWRGIRLQELVDASLGTLTADQRAQVDLLVIQSQAQSERSVNEAGLNEAGRIGAASDALEAGVSSAEVISEGAIRIPRSVLSKTAWLVALEKDGRPLSEPRLVLPDPQRPGVQKAGIPVTAGVSAPVATVELTSFAARFPSWILSRRSDPLAVRGETVFMQGCLSCHASPAMVDRPDHLQGAGVERSTHFFEKVSTRAGEGLANSHSRVEGIPFWTERDWRSVGSYIDALGLGRPSSAKPASAAGGATPGGPSA